MRDVSLTLEITAWGADGIATEGTRGSVEAVGTSPLQAHCLPQPRPPKRASYKSLHLPKEASRTCHPAENQYLLPSPASLVFAPGDGVFMFGVTPTYYRLSFHLSFLPVCCACAPVRKGQQRGAASLFPPLCGFCRLNSGHQAFRLSPSLMEPPCWPFPCTAEPSFTEGGNLCIRKITLPSLCD